MRMTAEERREQVIRAAVVEFSRRGLEGTSTEAIAKRVGISQPYLFRLFASKKALFIAAVRSGTERIMARMEELSEGLTGEAALQAMGEAYNDLIADRDLLLLQLHGFACCEDEEIRESVRDGFARLWTHIQRISGVPAHELVPFVAMGMLCNVVTAMDSERLRGLVDAYFEQHPDKHQGNMAVGAGAVQAAAPDTAAT